MIDLEFTFEESPLEQLLLSLEDGQIFSGAQLLTLSEGSSEQDLEDAFACLEQRQILPDLSDLQVPATGPEAAERLRMEAKWVEQGLPLEGLEETDTLRLYMEELAGIPVCGEVSQIVQALFDRKSTGQDAQTLRTRLAELSLGRVVELAGQYTNKGVLLLDLIQEGSIGLWRAVETLDTQSVPFEQLRDWWIRFYISKVILLQAREAGVGQHLRQAMEDYRSVDEKLLTELGRNPEPEELAQALHLSVQETLRIAQMVEQTRMIHRAHAPEPEQLPQEEDQAVEDTAYFQMRQRISDLLSTLPAREATLLTLRYGLEGQLPMKPQQVAARMGMTAEEVVALEAAALAKLRTENS